MSSGTEDEDQVRVSRTYNQSIYLMAGMPYLMLGMVGFLIYRHHRVRDGEPRPAALTEAARS